MAKREVSMTLTTFLAKIRCGGVVTMAITMGCKGSQFYGNAWVYKRSSSVLLHNELDLERRE